MSTLVRDDQSSLSHPRQWPTVGMARIPGWVYSDPDLFVREMERFFSGGTWNYVGLECELTEPGSFRRGWVGRRPVVVTRDNDGGINVIENRCAHRSSLVCWADTGKATDLTCPYHQWNYDLKGNLRGLPFRRGARGKGGMPADFSVEDHGLVKLKVETLGGSIWASFDDTTPSMESYLGPDLYPLVTRTFSGRPLRLIGHSRQLIPCNWKVYLDNSRDPYHATLLHTFFVTFGLLRADTPFRAQATEGGRHGIMASRYSPQTAATSNELTQQMRSLKANFTLNDMEVVRPVDEFGDSLMVNLSIFPSAFMQQHGNSLAVRQIIPIDVGNMELSWTYFGYADDDADMCRRRLKQGNMLGPAGFVAVDDGEVATQVQEGIRSHPGSEQVVEMGGRDTTEDDTMLSEAIVRGFYRFYRGELGL